ncbi:MAG: ATP-binding cassette domain-containing protein [Deltaproteobacteria bacterium]|nr:MAG: ATP-binding cassette domain-containing protein [Deltaproteobacteria bacterium]
MPSPVPVRFEGVCRRWRDRAALVDVDLALSPGERVALIGPSGSGKTTLLHLLMGALRSSAGRIRIGDVAIEEMTPAQVRAHRRQCALVDQGSLLIRQLTVHGNVVAGMLPHWPWWRVLASVAWSVERARVRALLDDVGLGDRQWDSAATLSGGQQQRVAIARALAGQPAFLLADEPTSALDPTTSDEVIALMAARARRLGATLVISTHRVSQVLDDVDRVVGLRAGRVVLDARPADVDDAALDALYEGSRERA